MEVCENWNEMKYDIKTIDWIIRWKFVQGCGKFHLSSCICWLQEDWTTLTIRIYLTKIYDTNIRYYLTRREYKGLSAFSIIPLHGVQYRVVAKLAIKLTSRMRTFVHNSSTHALDFAVMHFVQSWRILSSLCRLWRWHSFWSTAAASRLEWVCFESLVAHWNCSRGHQKCTRSLMFSQLWELQQFYMVEANQVWFFACIYHP